MYILRLFGCVIVAAALAALLGGCVYDPYTGGYYPCCSYYHPYRPYYANPPYGYGYGYQPPGYQQPPPPEAPPAR